MHESIQNRSLAKTDTILQVTKHSNAGAVVLEPLICL